MLIFFSNTALERCTCIYLLFYMFRQFYLAIIKQKHKYTIRKVCYARGRSFIINVIKYTN